MKVKKVVSFVVLAFVFFVGIVSFQWYSYVTNTKSPYDEVGIELNRYMPDVLQKWGCNQLKENFGTKALPPYGCADESGRAWR